MTAGCHAADASTDERGCPAASNRSRTHLEEAMSEVADRYRKVAGQLGERVVAVPETAWDNPSPCEGWVARDVVRHLVEWLPAFFADRWPLPPMEIPSVDDDPVAAWTAVNGLLRAGLDDPAIATAEVDTPMGCMSYEAALDMIGTNDLLIHTWDLARATGLDERLDPEEVAAMCAGMEPYADSLADSGQYGPRVPVPDDADAQTRLLAMTGRRA
jgi:uncharacterized protein (TIGR03086 family)